MWHRVGLLRTDVSEERCITQTSLLARSAQGHIPEDGILLGHRRGKRKIIHVELRMENLLEVTSFRDRDDWKIAWKMIPGSRVMWIDLFQIFGSILFVLNLWALLDGRCEACACLGSQPHDPELQFLPLLTNCLIIGLEIKKTRDQTRTFRVLRCGATGAVFRLRAYVALQCDLASRVACTFRSAVRLTEATRCDATQSASRNIQEGT
jgi:hypothetical protein